MPVSRKRNKPTSAPPTPSATPRKKGPSPVWVAPLMLTLMGVGVLWLVVFYITQPSMPLTGDLGNGNLLIGFAFIIAGFVVATQWR